MEENVKKKERFSYSKIGCFEQCRYKYKLMYRDHHFIDDGGAIATDFGTLIHYIEETMANKIITNMKLDMDDYNELIDLLYNVNINEGFDKVYGINILKQKYPSEWNMVDKSGRTYDEKVCDYLATGIFRLRDKLIQNPDLEIIGVEKEFNLEFRDYIFHGFIDRIFRDTATGQIYIEDVKTWALPADHSALTTPLQFVIYNLACQEIYEVTDREITCAYDLPLCNERQPAGTKGYMNRGLKKLNHILDEIETGDFEPNPSPLCHWCIFSRTKPNQPEEAKELCPYFSHWTKDNKDFSVEFDWMGPESHESILEAYKLKYDNVLPIIELPKEYNLTEDTKLIRRFLGRR